LNTGLNPLKYGRLFKVCIRRAGKSNMAGKYVQRLLAGKKPSINGKLSIAFV